MLPANVAPRGEKDVDPLTDQHFIGRQFGTGLAVRIAPDGNHELEMEVVQPLDQLRGLRVMAFVPLVGAPAIFAPILPVLHDEIGGNAATAKLGGRVEQLLLARVTLAALPEAERPFRPERSPAGGGAVAGDDVVELGTVKDRVIDRLAEIGAERRVVGNRPAKELHVPPSTANGDRHGLVRRQGDFSDDGAGRPHIRDAGDLAAIDEDRDILGTIGVAHAQNTYSPASPVVKEPERREPGAAAWVVEVNCSVAVGPFAVSAGCAPDESVMGSPGRLKSVREAFVPSRP